jgi:hypothetical protein
MGRKKSPGLFKRGEYWHIDKAVFGCRIRESTGTSSLEEAEKYLAKRIEEVRQASVFGVRPKRTFMEAAIKFLDENRCEIISIRFLCNGLFEIESDGKSETVISVHEPAIINVEERNVDSMERDDLRSSLAQNERRRNDELLRTRRVG